MKHCQEAQACKTAIARCRAAAHAWQWPCICHPSGTGDVGQLLQWSVDIVKCIGGGGVGVEAMAEGARSKLPFQGSSLRPQFVLTVCQPPWPLTGVLLSTLSIVRGCSLINHRCGEAAVRPQAFVSPGLDSITAVLTCHDLYTENHTHAGCSVITQLPRIWKDHGLQISAAASVPIHGSVKSTFPRGQLQPTLA